MVFVHSSFRAKHSSQICMEHDRAGRPRRGKLGDASRMTRNRDARRDPDESSTLLQGWFAKQFLSRGSVPLGGSSDPLRTRRAQDADAAF